MNKYQTNQLDDSPLISKSRQGLIILSQGVLTKLNNGPIMT